MKKITVKRFFVALLGFAIIFSTLCGCSGKGNDSGSAANGGSTAETGNSNGKGKTYRVAYIARAQSDSFAAWLCNEVKNEAEKNYPDIKVDIYDGQANDEKENSMIENAIANKYDGIIIQPNNNEAQRPYIEKVVKAGIKCITTNPRVDVEGASSVDSDPYKSAETIAKCALEQVPKNAQVVVLQGPSGNFHNTQRRKAWKEVFFDKRPDVKIVAEDFANWNKDEGMKLMEDWITAHPKVSAIISMNDNMAAGAIEAIKNKPQAKNILVYGSDGTAEGCLLVKSGKMTASVLQSAIDLAQKNMKCIHDLLTGKETNIQDKIGNPLITQGNVQQYIDMYKEKGLIK